VTLALDIGRRRLRAAVAAAERDGRPLPSVAIVGGGFSGLAAAMQLVRSGHRDFTVIEQSPGVGGTWRDNTYPGAACDVPSHLYSFSFHPKSDWSRRFAGQPEILSYAEQCVADYRLGPHLRLSTTVTAASWDDAAQRWHLDLTTPEGPDHLVADTVVFACGQLNRPAYPAIPGREEFAGPVFHSARWDHDVDLAGRRVAVVGSGASAIQFVPPVAEAAAHTTVFQHSPSYVGPKKDRTYSPATRTLLERSSSVERLYRWWIYWALESRWLWFRKDSRGGAFLRKLFTKGIREQVVARGVPERSVVPDYPVGCKRILISNDWYPTLLRPDVDVVDDPIVRVVPDGIVTADGTHRPADVLIFGTGFDTTGFLAHIPVSGLGGRTLAETWEGGARAYLGVTVPGFPNAYLLYGPNTNLGHNSILFMVERQLNLVLQALALQTAARTGGPVAVGVTEEAWVADDARTQRRMADTAWVAACHSWYKTATGRVTNNWPTWTVRYWFDTLRLRPTDVGVVGRASSPAGSPTAATPGTPAPSAPRAGAPDGAPGTEAGGRRLVGAPPT
jgi:cation diffusion facilitator CzcD-associated flavoprotein CzcO